MDTGEERLAETANGGKASTRFGLGNQAARGIDRKDQGKGDVKPPRVLVDMRWVYAKPKGKGGTTPARQMLRELLQSNPREFMAQLVGLEKAHGTRLAAARKQQTQQEKPAAVEPIGSDPEAEADEGSLRVEELIEEMLERARSESHE